MSRPRPFWNEMASIISHALAAVSLGKVFPAEDKRARFYVLAALCSILPDADVVGFYFGVRYGDLFGHRGFTHSLFFALLPGCAVASIFLGRRARCRRVGGGSRSSSSSRRPRTGCSTP